MKNRVGSVALDSIRGMGWIPLIVFVLGSLPAVSDAGGKKLHQGKVAALENMASFQNVFQSVLPTTPMGLEAAGLRHGLMKASVRDHAKEWVQAVCPTLKGMDYEGLIRNYAVGKACIHELSHFWKQRNFVETLSRISPPVDLEIRSLFQYFPPTFALNLLRFLYLQQMRSVLSERYFDSRFVGLMAKALGHPVLDVSECISGVGFNRLFSPSDLIGTSSASDVDFKVLYDESCFFDPVPQLKERIFATLQVAQREFLTDFSMNLEVGPFTVQSVEEIQQIFEKQNESEMNFFAAAVAAGKPLFGSLTLIETVVSTITIMKTQERLDRVFQQYIGVKTTKSSLKKLISKGDPRYPHIGSVHNPHQDSEWMFSMKYVLMRLYDFAPTRSATALLDAIGLSFEQLMIRKVEFEFSRTLHAGFTLEDEIRLQRMIDERYHFLTRQDFIGLMRNPDFRLELGDIFQTSCRYGLVHMNNCLAFQSVSQQLERLDREGRWAIPSAELNSALNQLGYSFFSDLFRSADNVGSNLESLFSPITGGGASGSRFEDK